MDEAAELEREIIQLFLKATDELRADLVEARFGELAERCRKAAYMALLDAPYKKLADFVHRYYREKRKSGIKDRFAIAQMYREEYGAWEEEYKRDGQLPRTIR